jgi:hypothetical protein
VTFSLVLRETYHNTVRDNVIWQFIYSFSVLLLYRIAQFALVFLQFSLLTLRDFQNVFVMVESFMRGSWVDTSPVRN